MIAATISVTRDAACQVRCNAARFLSNHLLGLCPDGVHLSGVRREGTAAGDRPGFEREVGRRLRELAGEILFDCLLSLLPAMIFIVTIGLTRVGIAAAICGLLCLLLCLLLLIPQSVKAALHQGPEIHKDPVDGLTARTCVIIVDGFVDPGNVLVQLINELAGITG